MEHERAVLAINRRNGRDALLFAKDQSSKIDYPVWIDPELAADASRSHLLREMPEFTNEFGYPGWRDLGLPGTQFVFWGLIA
jgi:hypothetical protein